MMRLGMRNSISAAMVVIMLVAAAAKPVTLSGKVVDANERRVAGARVSSYEVTDGPFNGTFAVRVLEEVTTGADGAFAFKTGTSPVYSQNIIIARKQGLALGWALYPPSGISERNVTLGQAGQIDGMVVDPNGKPLAGAQVLATAAKTRRPGEDAIPLPSSLARQLFATTTDAQGRFVLSDLPLDAEFELAAQKPGFATVITINRSRAEAPVPASLRQPPVVMMAPAQACIEGIVVERDTRKPIEGVALALKSDRLSEASQPVPVKSQADGRFRFDGLPPGRHVLSTALPWKGPVDWVAQAQNVTLAPGELKKDVQVAVGQGGLLEVTVKAGGADKSIPDVPLGLQDAQGTDLGGVLSDANGLARLRLPAGKYGLGALSIPGYTTSREKQRIVLRDGQIYRTTLRLDERPRITGIVRDPNGTAVAGALLCVPAQDRGEAIAYDIVADADGKFTATWDPRFEYVPWTSFYLLARDPQRDLAAIVNINTNIKALDVNLAPAVTLTGKAVDPNGQGIPGASLRIWLKATHWDARTDINGNFQIGGIPAIEPNQSYSVCASADGYGRQYNSQVRSNDAANRRISLDPFTLPRPSASVSGQVVDEENKPVPGAVLDAVIQSWARADAEGRFTIRNLCAGKAIIDADAICDGIPLSGYAETRSGAGDIRIVVLDHWTPGQVQGIRTYEEVTSGGGKFIAGTTVDESGKPVAGVAVQVLSFEEVKDGQVVSITGTTGFYYDNMVTTDRQGRFAIPVEREENLYNLLFRPVRHAATIVYDVPAGARNLNVVMEKGGSIEGRLLRLEKGRKVPVPYAEVKIDETSRHVFNHLSNLDRQILTDAEGRFHFEHLQTRIRPGGTWPDKQWSFELREWRLTSGDAKAEIVFAGGDEIKDFELIDRPELKDAKPLLGDSLPSLDDLKAGLPAEQLKDKALLVCFFDVQQRPSRNAVLQLAKRAEELKAKDIVIIAVEVSEAEKEAVNTWAKQNNVPIPVAAAGAASEEVRFTWSAQALPWLVLADKNHLVRAEGFGVDEIESRLASLADTQK